MRVMRAIKHGMLAALTLSLVVGLSPFANKAEARRHRSHHTSTTSDTSGGGRHHSRHHGRHKVATSKVRHAYPADIFMMNAPAQDLSLLPPDESLKVRYSFESGTADNFPPAYLVRSGAVNYFPLHGGIYERREAVKYIVVHSTETGVPQDARHVINSWSSGGLRHPGAQYIVDRDGTIFETVDPKFATVHVNIFKTLPGINNDNSVGIEMCHTGNQTYPAEQRAAVTRLVSYLQDRYHVLNDNVITHRYAQQGDHTDPVAFDWEGFLASKDNFHNHALAMKHEPGPAVEEVEATADVDVPPAAVYLEMHRDIQLPKRFVHLDETPQLGARRFAHSDLTPAAQTTQQVYTQIAPRHASFLGSSDMQPATASRLGNTVPAPIRGAIELPPDTATQFRN